ncbi:ATP-binding protein [Caulobacter sp. 17J80-11]|uniref:ATP-binding protein n=1 Tax=Caulobacter sp. 17J80-11 TaxID=2763502 RepID=UPI001653C2E5|nr:ATP-binding protein [Caulobacter sp. 17J80-11]MBC6981294.1 ATP-binding protein [Caulobacter sp. 17J80-11]
MRPRAIFLIGLPGSGKTTWVERYRPAPDQPFAVISTDRLIEREAARLGIAYDEAYRQLPSKKLAAEARRLTRQAVERGWDVVIDRTNLRAPTRATFLRLFPPAYVRAAIVFAVPWAELERRLTARAEAGGHRVGPRALAEMAAIYDPPGEGEFDLVTFHQG